MRLFTQKKSVGMAIAALALVLGSVRQAKASYMLVTTRPTGGDLIDWGQLGPSFTTLTSPQSWTSNGGLTGMVSDGGTLERRDEDPGGGGGWAGNFGSGDHLLWNQDNDSPETLFSFSTTVSQVGAQVSADSFGPFTATITAYDSMGNQLATFTEAGDNVDTNGDNSAIYLGIAGPGISSVTLSTNEGQIAINQVTLNGNVATTPEPASLTLLGICSIGLFGCAGLRRRKKAAPPA